MLKKNISNVTDDNRLCSFAELLAMLIYLFAAYKNV